MCGTEVGRKKMKEIPLKEPPHSLLADVANESARMNEPRGEGREAAIHEMSLGLRELSQCMCVCTCEVPLSGLGRCF